MTLIKPVTIPENTDDTALTKKSKILPTPEEIVPPNCSSFSFQSIFPNDYLILSGKISQCWSFSTTCDNASGI